ARRTLAEKFQQDAGMVFVPELVTMVDNLEAELQQGVLSDANRAWLAQCGLTPEQIQNQMEPEYTPQRKIHLYHCDHRGLPLALVNAEGKADWSAEYDAWGNVLSENNPHNLKQLIRLPGQQYDEETGLYYNRHRYYDPLQGRYITQDPIGLRGGINKYQYPLNPIQQVDPFGLNPAATAAAGASIGSVVPGVGTVVGAIVGFAIGVGLTYLACKTVSHVQKCAEERAACEKLCDKAAQDPDYSNIYGGSHSTCMRGCLSVECGGNPVS
ncbi:TPA: RHS repeat protein, partial [Salmonella enterica subsp. enterica serovar Liverpool]